MPPRKTSKSGNIDMVIQEPSVAQTSAGTPPAPIDEVVAPKPPVAKPYEQSTEKAALNAIEKIWIIGPWLIVIYRIWRLQGLILFLSGLFSGVVIISLMFLFGAIPISVLPEKYRGQPTPPVVEEQRNTPHGDLPIMEVEENNEWKSWLDDIRMLCNHEIGRFELTQKPRTTVKKLRAAFSSPTTEFPWRFSVDQSRRIVFVRGFRVTNTGLVFPLSGEGDESTMTFNVPACAKGDTLVAIATTVTRTPNDNKEPVFQSAAP